MNQHTRKTSHTTHAHIHAIAGDHWVAQPQKLHVNSEIAEITFLIPTEFQDHCGHQHTRDTPLTVAHQNLGQQNKPKTEAELRTACNANRTITA